MACVCVCTLVSIGSIGYFQEVVARLSLLSLFLNQISESETCRTGHHFLQTHKHTQTPIMIQASTKCDHCACAKQRKSLCNLHLLSIYYNLCVSVLVPRTGLHVRASVCVLFGPLMLSVLLIHRKEGNEHAVTATATQSLPDTTNTLLRCWASCLNLILFTRETNIFNGIGIMC